MKSTFHHKIYLCCSLVQSAIAVIEVERFRAVQLLRELLHCPLWTFLSALSLHCTVKRLTGNMGREMGV